MLAAVPEFAARIGEMADVGPEWGELVEVWPDLCATMDEELAKHPPSCPLTYALMKASIYRGYARRDARP